MHSSRMRTVHSSGRISGVGGVGWGLLRGGVCSGGWGVSASGGCLLRGCLLLEMSALGGVCSGEGLSALGWVGGVCSGGVSHHALRQTPPPPCGQTDACKNITFATSLRTVINSVH